MYPFFLKKKKSPLISHVWSLCIVKEAMFIILIGLWPIRLFISDLYISGTHNFLIYIFYFTFFLNGRFYAWLGPERHSGAVKWFFGKRNSWVLPQLCVHNSDDYDYDENNKRYLFHLWLFARLWKFCLMFQTKKGLFLTALASDSLVVSIVSIYSVCRPPVVKQWNYTQLHSVL